jgi:hypothetical protein
MFGKFHQSNLKAPVFDFDGRMMEDVASGHDNAFAGGASFQQTIAEYRMSQFLQRIRVPHVLCIGYGKLEMDAATSWFSLHDWDPRLVRVVPPDVSPDEFASAKLRSGKELLNLALRHNLIGHCGLQHVANFVGDADHIQPARHGFRYHAVPCRRSGGRVPFGCPGISVSLRVARRHP